MDFQPIFLQGGFDTGSLLFFGAMMLVFWLFLLRPQAKRQKEQRNFIESLQKGDDIVTGSGLLGRINKIDGDIITVELGNKNFVRVTKSSISKEMTEAVYAGGKNKPKEEEKEAN
ncbi:MAG: preprotein translocase subunit YajC [Saprospiraceae bacterium]|nr:preprotein translocase subunit YajC [Saprospiraceae bacterium]